MRMGRNRKITIDFEEKYSFEKYVAGVIVMTLLFGSLLACVVMFL